MPAFEESELADKITLKYVTYYDKVDDFDKLFNNQKETKVSCSRIQETLFEYLGADLKNEKSDLTEKGKATRYIDKFGMINTCRTLCILKQEKRHSNISGISFVST